VGEDFTRRDRTALLYQTKFAFTPDNVPIVNILVMEGASSIRFSSDAPIELRPEGEGGTTIRVAKDRPDCTATLVGGKPARIRYWVGLARVPARDLDAVRRGRAEWEGRGMKTRSFERGSVFGFYGRTLDNRVLVLVEDAPLATPGEARTRRDAVARSSGVATVDVFEEPVERPAGTVRVACEGLDATLDFPGMVEAAPAPQKRLQVKAVEFGKGFPWHGREDRSYRGRLVLTADRDGRLAVVNAVDAETLLQGLVPSEIYVDAPAEALKAQAVAARGELFAKLGQRHTADPYMVCGDVHCQAYRGTLKEDPRTSRAVAATRGEMVFAGERLVDSVYSASCGGHTESGAAVWQGAGHDYLKGVPDGPDGVAPYPSGVTEDAVAAFVDRPPAGLFCGATRYGRESFRWTRTVTAGEARQGVLDQTGIDVGPVKGLKVLERGVSGRVTRLEVRGDKASVTVSPELAIRKALSGLKSSLFVFTAGPGNFVFRGAGFGHGVGMCQNGAIGMADKGARYGDVLKHYFPGGEVVKIY
jgi:SpoIID/LytB domain protein